MNKNEIMEYIANHRKSLFHITTEEPVCRIPVEHFVTRQITHPVTGNPITRTFRECRQEPVTDFTAMIPEADNSRESFLTIVLCSPHFTESARNWISIKFDNIKAIETLGHREMKNGIYSEKKEV
jgi:hypothetical protein